ncbi:hypothetical protein ATPR_1274 [Acetobacter tropicalis NBRC 101654]|uniref:Uncharacterized protein n=1 Tax=Acetobacter tropicalis NBRC 101654 TaxID=749388 RepID=F7VD25_9PROT|nr:hypothetical protein ATPR_1274 [Acetobacter tropicalis NBRC 101654]
MQGLGANRALNFGKRISKKTLMSARRSTNLSGVFFHLNGWSFERSLSQTLLRILLPLSENIPSFLVATHARQVCAENSSKPFCSLWFSLGGYSDLIKSGAD